MDKCIIVKLGNFVMEYENSTLEGGNEIEREKNDTKSGMERY